LVIDNLTIRQLQQESARALTILEATNHNLAQFNKEANHNSNHWYKSIINWYVQQYGDLPSKCGPGKDVVLLDV